MKEIIRQIEEYKGYIQSFIDKDFEASCPCFGGKLKINGQNINLNGHCWRTCSDMNKGKDKYCSFNGLHIKTKLDKKEIQPLIKAIKKQLDSQKWYSKWEVVYGNK